MLFDEENELIGGLLHGDPSPNYLLQYKFISRCKLQDMSKHINKSARYLTF